MQHRADIPHILVVDDDDRLRALLKRFLHSHGFIVSATESAKEARLWLTLFAFDLMVLDVMMPGESGLALAESLRTVPDAPPVLMLSALADTEDRLSGFEAGVDDYLTKPFEPKELLMRIRAILRRTAKEQPVAACVQFGPYTLQLESGMLERDGTLVHLTSAETALLRALADTPGEAVPREALAKALGQDASERAVDVQVTRLRRKIEPEERPHYILTQRGAGYMLRGVRPVRWLKRFSPRTLFARALLIVVMPTILVQIVTAYIFYERHWENVTRHMANALAGEVAFLSYNVARMPHEDREAMQWIFEKTTNISARFTEKATLENLPPGTADFPPFQQVLARRIDMPFAVRRLDREGLVEVNIQLADGVLSFRTSLKRLESGTTSIFMLWMSGASLLFLCIALLFLRNQIRPIRQLAEAAESFGKGQDMPYFKPSGALEVRRAARAFLIMRERIQRQIRSRTEMLAGISHDLRTPLTRMKLQLAMAGEAPEVRELTEDVSQMEHMIAEYLDFAKGSGGEDSQVVRLSELLASIAGDYRRSGQDIALEIASDAEIALKPQAFRRMLQNLIDNALRYGKECRVILQPGKSKIEIWVDDSGPGIPPEKREEVFRPFTRLDDSRNPRTGGAGLGLTIARDIARGHGGNITLIDAPDKGLRAVVRIPR